MVNNADLNSGVILQTGVAIGSPGLGSKLDVNGKFHDFPHFGRVGIGEDTIIQDRTVINRGTLNDTIIGSNVRIGPQGWFAHGVTIGDSCFISQGATVAGSVIIGKHSKIWGNVSIRDGIIVGESAVVGLGSVVTKNIPDNELWFGNPAKFRRRIV